MIGFLCTLLLIPLFVQLIDVVMTLFFHSMERDKKDRRFYERLNSNADQLFNQAQRYNGRK